jgi:quercetin dioxygenase-like cupin family protein
MDTCGSNTRVRTQQVTGNSWAEDLGCFLDDAEIGLAGIAAPVQPAPRTAQPLSREAKKNQDVDGNDGQTPKVANSRDKERSMSRSMKSRRPTAISMTLTAALATTGWLAIAGAQTAGQAAVPAAGVSIPGFDARPVLSSPVSGNDQREIVLIASTIQPDAASPPHTHPGGCVGTVIDGQIELCAVGKDALRVNAGEAFAKARAAAHQFVNVGDKPVRRVTTLVVDKGKPCTLTQSELK